MYQNYQILVNAPAQDQTVMRLEALRAMAGGVADHGAGGRRRSREDRGAEGGRDEDGATGGYGSPDLFGAGGLHGDISHHSTDFLLQREPGLGRKVDQEEVGKGGAVGLAPGGVTSQERSQVWGQRRAEAVYTLQASAKVVRSHRSTPARAASARAGPVNSRLVMTSARWAR